MTAIHCPILGKEIDGATCLTIVDVADHVLTETALQPILAKGEEWTAKKRKTCLECKYHDDITE